LKLNKLYVQNSGGNLSNPLIIHYTGSSVTLPIQQITQPFVLYTVDWGDGTIETLAVNSPSHTYASSQLYIINIYVNIQGILVKFNQNLSMWQNVSRIPSVGNERICSEMFRYISSFPSQVISDLETLWDTSQVTRMPLMFDSSVFNGAIGGWNTINVTDMYGMFANATSFDQPLNTWNTSNVTNMSLMFDSATSFDQPLNNWNTINVTSMYAMFNNADSFDQPLNTWNTSNVINMAFMFQYADSFDQPLNWNTINVTDMFCMFQSATSFDQPLNWNTSNVTIMTAMFANATSFDQPLNWNTINVTIMAGMFYNATAMSLTSIASLASWNVSNVTNMNSMFSVLIDTQVFTSILNGWKNNGGVQSNMTIGVNGSQQAFLAGGLQTYYETTKNWTFNSTQTGNTINIWV
jgi:surface protein